MYQIHFDPEKCVLRMIAVNHRLKILGGNKPEVFKHSFDYPYWSRVRYWNFPPIVEKGLKCASHDFPVTTESNQDVIRFWKSIPSQLIHVIQNIRFNPWRALYILTRLNDVYELANRNPYLFFALCNSEFILNHPLYSSLKSIDDLIHKKQRDVLELFGFENREWIAKITQKVCVETLNVTSFKIIRKAILSENVSKRLRHLSAFNGGILSLIKLDLFRLLSPKVLNEISSLPKSSSQDAVIMIRDTIRMLIALNHPTLLSRNSLKSIRDLHDELSNRMSLKLKNLTNRKYPAPPIDGIELEVEFVLHKYKWNSSVSIKPILNTFRLAKEAEEMKHCCLSYDDAIQQRRSYLYSIHAGKHRGTLEIIPNRRDQSWRIHQLKGKYNHTNFPKTLMTILEDWVSESKRLEIKHAPKSAREKNSEKSKILLGNQPLLFDLFEETIE